MILLLLQYFIANHGIDIVSKTYILIGLIIPYPEDESHREKSNFTLRLQIIFIKKYLNS